MACKFYAMMFVNIVIMCGEIPSDLLKLLDFHKIILALPCGVNIPTPPTTPAPCYAEKGCDRNLRLHPHPHPQLDITRKGTL